MQNTTKKTRIESWTCQKELRSVSCWHNRTNTGAWQAIALLSITPNWFDSLYILQLEKTNSMIPISRLSIPRYQESVSLVEYKSEIRWAMSQQKIDRNRNQFELFFHSPFDSVTTMRYHRHSSHPNRKRRPNWIWAIHLVCKRWP